MEEKESYINSEMDKKNKQRKQFVIVKEYNGSHNIQKKTRREYTEKTMLKEKLSKSERNSLEDVFLDRKREQEGNNDREKESKLKYVTFVELLPVSTEDKEHSDLNDNNESYYMNDDESSLTIENLSNDEDIKEKAEIIKESANNEYERVNNEEEIVHNAEENPSGEKNILIENLETNIDRSHNKKRRTKEIVSETTIKTIKDGAFYSILTAGGLLGAYALFKGVTSFDNN